MAMPNFTMKELLEAGIHFGHQTNRWNPKMENFLFGERNGIHIIDLQQSVPLIQEALKVLRDVAQVVGECYLLELNVKHKVLFLIQLLIVVNIL